MVLYAQSVEKAEAPEDPLVYFRALGQLHAGHGLGLVGDGLAHIPVRVFLDIQIPDAVIGVLQGDVGVLQGVGEDIKRNCRLIPIQDQEGLNTEFLNEVDRRYQPERVQMP